MGTNYYLIVDEREEADPAAAPILHAALTKTLSVLEGMLGADPTNQTTVSDALADARRALGIPKVTRCERLHIGKSSMGWTFALHVDPEAGIRDLPDWERLWSQPDARIEDEYGRAISIEDMHQTIAERMGRPSTPDIWNDATYLRNHAEPGPNNLVRSIVDGVHCIGHGAGTWDLITGEFS